MSDKVDIAELEQQFSDLALEIYEAGERRITPVYPWVLIRLVPKEQRYGSLHLPDVAGSGQQNKPLWEGIVLETWPSQWRTWKGTVESMHPQTIKDKSKSGKPLEESERIVSREVWHSSDFVRGDRILFPSFAGMPVNFLDETKYRLVREWTWDANGGVMGSVRYQGENKIKTELDALMKDLYSTTLSGK